MTSKTVSLFAFIGIGLIAAIFFLAAVLLRSQQDEPTTPRSAEATRPHPATSPPATEPAPSKPAPLPATAKPAPEGPVDLIKMLDPQKDAVAGTWTRDGDLLMSPAIPFGRIQLPALPPDEYDLTLSVERKSGVDSFNIGLTSGGRPCVVILDGMKNGDTSGIDIVGGKGFMENETTFKGRLLLQDQPAQVVCSVRKDRITVSVDGKKIIDWTGSPAKLSAYRGWAVPEPRALFVGSYESGFRVQNLVLSPVTGTALLLR
ncbi:MAG TPA: hypothetical protein VJB14_00270 [Planctomycetota bacterium]|nr:hypothetical protein [Planctomycetota bacterium]